MKIFIISIVLLVSIVACDKAQAQPDVNIHKQNEGDISEKKLVVDGLEVVTKVDGFYHNAWNKLLWVVAALGAVVGIIMPHWLLWLQKKTFEQIEKNLLKEIKAQKKIFDKRINRTQFDMHRTFGAILQNMPSAHPINSTSARLSACRFGLESEEFVGVREVVSQIDKYVNTTNDAERAELKRDQGQHARNVKILLKRKDKDHDYSRCLKWADEE